MRPIDLLGLGPTYVARQAEHNNWEVTVTPPAFTGLPPNTITFTPRQYEGFKLWREGRALIQNVLPELTGAEREVLMTGIGNEDFKRITAEDEE